MDPRPAALPSNNILAPKTRRLRGTPPETNDEPGVLTLEAAGKRWAWGGKVFSLRGVEGKEHFPETPKASMR